MASRNGCERERKLAPQRIAAGSTTQRQRTKSISKRDDGWLDKIGLTGQSGRISITEYAPQAIATMRRAWHHPSARRGLAAVRPMNAPMLLPMPSPARIAAMMSEKVYVVAPRRSDSKRVQSTSAPSGGGA